MNYENQRSNLYKELHPSILENPKFLEVVGLIVIGLFYGALIAYAITR